MSHRVLFTLSMLLVLGLLGCEEDNLPSSPVSVEGQSLLAVVMDNGLLLLDRERGEWLGNPLGLGSTPNDVLVDEDHLYVINSMSCDLQEFRYESGEIRYVRRLDLGLQQNRNPYAGAVTGDGRLLVSNLLDNSVSVVNLASWSVDTLWNAGLAPEGINVDERFAYVINSGYDFTDFSFHAGSLYKFDLEAGECLDTLELGINAQFGEFLPDGNLAVSCTGDYSSTPGEVLLVDLESWSVEQRLSMQGYPGRISTSTEGYLYCAAGGWEVDGEDHGLVLRIDSFGFSTLPEPISTSLGTIDVAALEAGCFYVASREGEAIELYNADTLSVTWSLPDRPVAIALWTLPNL